ncbi:Hachiman antiphage defense system protein HamA, partial [Cyclobacterium plantarum]
RFSITFCLRCQYTCFLVIEKVPCSIILLKNKGQQDGIWFVGPRKWRWKGDKNKPCHGSDVVVFHRHEHTPSDNDRIEVVESKMKATASNSAPIQNAINGALDDKTKRLAKTLNWIHDRLATDGKPRLREAINRYRFLDENPTYHKKFHAIAIIDHDLVEDEIAKETQKDDDEIEVSVISMRELKSAYEETYNAMLNHLQ